MSINVEKVQCNSQKACWREYWVTRITGLDVSLSNVSHKFSTIPPITSKTPIPDFQSKDREFWPLQLSTKVELLAPSDFKYQHSVIAGNNYLLKPNSYLNSPFLFNNLICLLLSVWTNHSRSSTCLILLLLFSENRTCKGIIISW